MESKQIFPLDLFEIIEQEGVWESEKFPPFFISAEETHHNDREIIAYQVDLEIETDFGEPFSYAKALNANLDGFDWENIIRIYLKSKDAPLEDAIDSGSEAEACVLWTSRKSYFEKLMNHLSNWLSDAKESIDTYQADR